MRRFDETGMTAPRSVMLLIADDWSPIAGCYGHEWIRTPRIDALAGRSTVFDHAFCTTPSSAASRAAILTGHHGHTHGQYGHCHGTHGFRTHEWMRTIPVVLRDAGAASALLGKAHVLPRSVYPFDVWDERDSDSATTIAGRAGEWIAAQGDRPFYLHAGGIHSHRATEPFAYCTEGHTDEFEDAAYAEDEVEVPDWLPDTPAVRRDLAAYARAVTRHDQFVGAVLDALEGSGRAESTLVILLSDHGMPFPGAKASSFEAGHHCPLLVARPGGAARHSQALVNWLDIAPTVYDWLGIDEELIHPDRDHPRFRPLPGRSVLPILDQTDPDGWDETFYAHNLHGAQEYFPYRVLRGRRYKLVRHLAWPLSLPLPPDLFRSGTWQAVREGKLEMMGRRPTRRLLHHEREAFFDLESDPLELHNLIEEPSLAEVAADMRQRLLDHRIATGDGWLEIDFQEDVPAAPGRS